MTCGRCGSDRLYQFEASPTVRVEASPLPLVCRGCGVITIDGEAIQLPQALECQAMEVAEAAAHAGEQAREQLEEEDPTATRIEKYFENVYRKGYLDGFFRCLAFFRHNSKEGRLRRMRELWDAGSPCCSTSVDSIDRQGKLLAEGAYTEFEQLLHLSAVPGETDASSSAHKRSSE